MNFTHAFQALCSRAGVRRVRLHDLRHTCVSLLLDLGEHPRLVMEIVGHTALEMTMNVYGHVSLDSQRTALNRLDDLLGE
jgi:integrase